MLTRLPLLLGLAGCASIAATSSSANSSSPVIPWLPTRPPTPTQPPLAPPCQADGLRASLFLQGATGNLTGAAIIRNVSGTPCSLLGRAGARFEGAAAASTPVHVFQSPAPAPDLSAVYDAPSSLRALALGRAAAVELFWGNWCPPDTAVTTAGTPPEALVLVLPAGRGELRLPLQRAPRCDAPGAPSSISVTPFLRRGRYLPGSSHLPLAAAFFGVPGPQSKLTPPALHVRRGGLLRYMISLTNISTQPFRFKSCPVYVEDFAGTGKAIREFWVLNCRPMGTLRPGGRAVFAMVIHIPRDAALGLHVIFWELAPRTYLPPDAAGLEGRVVVTA